MSLQARLSSYYFFYFAFFGTLLPYASLYYQSLGFDAVQIGQLMAAFVVTKIVAPNLFGWLSDKTGHQIYWVRFCNVFAVLTGIGLLYFQSFEMVLLSVMLFSFFFHGALPLYEAYTFSSLKTNKAGYGRIRLWGSVGFIVAVMVFGWALDWVSIDWVPWFLVAFLALTLMVTFWVKDQKGEGVFLTDLSIKTVIKNPAVLSLLWVSLLINISHGAYYSFYSIHLSETGYSKSMIAFLWSLGVVAEIAIFMWMAAIFKHFSIGFILLLTLALTGLRWVMIPVFVDSLSLLLFAQLLHAFSYGAFHVVAISLIDKYFQKQHQSRGQALYAAISHGVGGAVGMLLAGYAWFYGGASWAFGFGVVVVLIAFLVAYRYLRKEVISTPLE